MTDSFSFSRAQFENLFPFYLRINKDLEVIAMGRSLAKIYPLAENKLFNNFFSIPRPLTKINVINDLVMLQNQIVILHTSLD